MGLWLIDWSFCFVTKLSISRDELLRRTIAITRSTAWWVRLSTIVWCVGSSRPAAEAGKQMWIFFPKRRPENLQQLWLIGFSDWLLFNEILNPSFGGLLLRNVDWVTLKYDWFVHAPLRHSTLLTYKWTPSQSCEKKVAVLLCCSTVIEAAKLVPPHASCTRLLIICTPGSWNWNTQERVI